MAQNLPKNIICSVASIYQANLVIEIPNITENYVNSHLFTCRHWVAACLFKYTSRCWEVFLIGQTFFYSEGLGAKRNASGKLGMKLAISLETKELKIDFICMSLYSLHLGFLDGSVICYTGFSWTSVANKKEASHFYVHQFYCLVC